MREKLELLLKLAARYHATDVHFTVKQETLKISVRGIRGIIELHEPTLDLSLFHYLKYLANLDLGNLAQPQSGNFQLSLQDKNLYFRFSLLMTPQLQTGVLRILNNHLLIDIHHLSPHKHQNRSFINWTRFRSGMIILSGPTSSGKTTTLHAILSEIASHHKLKIITLEDPIEIHSDEYLQLQINEQAKFTYEEGIKQLLRHDPDVIMIGEIRDSQTAKMAFRCALSGHMVFSTVHAKSAAEAVKRLCELGLRRDELLGTLSAITNQRLFAKKGKKERICIYEILEHESLEQILQNQSVSQQHQDIFQEIRIAVKEGWISEKEAAADLETSSK